MLTSKNAKVHLLNLGNTEAIKLNKRVDDVELDYTERKLIQLLHLATTAYPNSRK